MIGETLNQLAITFLAAPLARIAGRIEIFGKTAGMHSS